MGLHHQDPNNNNNSSSELELVLGLSLNTSSFTPSPPPPSSNKAIDEEPSLTLGLYDQHHLLKLVQVPTTKIINDLCASQNSPHSVVSSFSSGRVAVKREISSEEVDATERLSSRLISDEDEDGTTTARKKLRLTKDQSALLEDSFKQHSTLNPKQKQALARQLNLRPRQVEVWFQNRRARTKLKQTEVDCEFLKKCCETLTDENRRLQKELQELKALKLSHPLYMPMPAATLTMCPSCERLSALNAAPSNNTPFSSLAPKSHHHHHFYNPFTNPSAAC